MASPTVADKLTALNEGRRREVNEYQVPAQYAKDGQEGHTVGLVELTAEEEFDASKRARNEGARLAFELAKSSLYEVDGKRVSIADGSVDKAWADFTAPLRNLVLQAFSDIHAPEDAVATRFLKGRKRKV